MSNSSKKHAKNVTGIFTRIAGIYDLLNTVLSLGFDALWRRRQVGIILPALKKSNAVVLDLAAGTLAVSKRLFKVCPEAKILAVDFCHPMLLTGKERLKGPIKNSLIPAVGDALKLPLADESVDAITVAFGLRNFKPRDKALKEAYRVLKPNGMLCVLEFGSAKDRILFGLYNWYLAKLLPFVGKLVSKDKTAYQYLADTIASFPSAEALVTEFEHSGFSKVSYKRYTAGIVCIHHGRKIA